MVICPVCDRQVPAYFTARRWSLIPNDPRHARKFVYHDVGGEFPVLVHRWTNPIKRLLFGDPPPTFIGEPAPSHWRFSAEPHHLC